VDDEVLRVAPRSLSSLAAERRRGSSAKYAVDENKDALDREGESVEGYCGGHKQGVKVSKYPK
jgi:hypothetical protein